MIRLKCPAGLEDVVALTPGVMMPSAYWRALVLQIGAGASAVLIDDQGRRLMVVGLLPAGHGCELLWLAASPAASRRMVAILRTLRLTLAAACECRRVTVYGYVAPGHSPSARILRLLGFSLAGQDHGFDRWERTFEGQA